MSSTIKSTCCALRIKGGVMGGGEKGQKRKTSLVCYFFVSARRRWLLFSLCCCRFHAWFFDSMIYIIIMKGRKSNFSKVRVPHTCGIIVSSAPPSESKNTHMQNKIFKTSTEVDALREKTSNGILNTTWREMCAERENLAEKRFMFFRCRDLSLPRLSAAGYTVVVLLSWDLRCGIMEMMWSILKIIHYLIAIVFVARLSDKACLVRL